MKKIIMIILVIPIAAAGLFAFGQAESGTIYVDADVNNTNHNGKSWDTAFSDLQDALAAAEAGDEIWVAEGIYTPSETDSKISFNMIDEVDIYGGFSGSETSFGDRDWETNTTILSGEIGDSGRLNDNSLTVVMAANSAIDGFTVTGGYGMMNGPRDSVSNTPESETPTAGGAPEGSSDMQGPPPSDEGEGGPGMGHLTPTALISGGSTPGTGSGIQIWQVSPEIRNCIITGNNSGKAGGIYIVGNFSGGPEMEAEGVEKPETVMPVFINCEISDNTATGRGGGISIDLGGSGIFIDCIFSGNTCIEGKGGAVYNDFGCSPYFANCLFISNFAQSGGAMGNDGESNPVIYASTFYSNEASAAGAGLYQGSGPFNDPRIIDTIIRDNICYEDEANIYSWNDCNPLVLNSIVGDADNGIDSDSIGYSAEAAESRTDSEIEGLIAVLMDIPLNETPEVLDLGNPVTVIEVSGSGPLYVTAGGTGTGNSWSDAADLQFAINSANLYYLETGNSVKIWVTEGTYLPGDERSDSFILREGAELYGGFSGTETTLKSRDTLNNNTILSGDTGVSGVKTDNSYHVVIGSDNAVLDGFTITDGYADGFDGEVYDNKGGAVLNYHGGYRVRPDISPVIGFDTIFRNCDFVDNYAEEGGAVFTYHGGNPVFEDCGFIENRAIYGAATVDRGGVNSKYYDCEFVENEASYKAGAVFVDYGSMSTFENCLFSENKAGTSGGAIYVIDRASQEILNETDVNLVDQDWPSTTDIYSTILVIDTEF